MRRHEEAQLLTLSPRCTEAQLLTSPSHCRLRHSSNHNNRVNISLDINPNLDIKFNLTIFPQTSLAAVMEHIMDNQTLRCQVVRTAGDLEDQEEQVVLEAMAGQTAAALEAAALAVAALADQEALVGAAAASADQVVQAAAAVREDLEVQDTQVEGL